MLCVTKNIERFEKITENISPLKNRSIIGLCQVRTARWDVIEEEILLHLKILGPKVDLNEIYWQIASLATLYEILPWV